MIKLGCLKEVADQWYPNIDGKYVEVKLYKYPEGEDDIVCVWGGDDNGMEYIGKDAEYLFHRLLEEDILSHGICGLIGLKPA